MEDYPANYVTPLRPLVVLSGLTNTFASTEDHFLQRNGPVLSSQAPVVTTVLAQQLLTKICSWGTISIQKSGGSDDLYSFKACGRQYTFPCTKANPPASPVSSPLEASRIPGGSTLLHSPLSPLSGGSPIYPDGLFTPLWPAKYQEVVPAVFVSFFSLGSDPIENTARDAHLIGDISRLKSFFDNTGYRTRFAAVLVGDESAMDTPDIDERIENIRRGAKLDTKGTFYVIPAGVSEEELAELTESFVVSIRPLALDFYRELARHARRKRDTGYTPPQTTLPDGRIQYVLSESGWTTRYEYKLGMFAEYRGDLDSATRNYANVIDNLFDPNGLFETTPCWSPRWNEMRLFADACSIRIIRCLLQNKQSTAAVRRWRIYRMQTHSLLNRRGKGTVSYGWDAWESRWAKVMAQLIQDNLTIPLKPEGNESTMGLHGIPAFVAAAGLSSDDRPLPWDCAHHAGYWFFLAAEFMRVRREKARNISDSDRTPPGQSPATSVARRNELYDTYLCPEPHLEYPNSPKSTVNHTQLIVSLFDKAVVQFRSRAQFNMADRLDLATGEELMQQSRYTEAFLILKPVWRRATWRKAKWWTLCTELGWALHRCAREIGDVEVALSTLWELSFHDMPLIIDLNYDIEATAKLLADSFPTKSKVSSIELSQESIINPISAYFLFATAECHATETIVSQLVLTSNAHFDTPPITFSSLAINFSGSFPDVNLVHNTSRVSAQSSPIDVQMVDLGQKQDENQSDMKKYVTGEVSLILNAGHTVVLSLRMIPRDTGSVHLREAHATINCHSVNLQIPLDLGIKPSSAIWYCMGAKGTRGKRVPASLTNVKVLPRQPRVEIILRDSEKQYLTDERVSLDVEVINNENEAAEMTLDVQILGNPNDPPRYTWTTDLASQLEAKALNASLGIMLPSQQILKSILVQMPSVASDLRFQIHASYRLSSSADHLIVKSLTDDLSVVGPFEANYEVSPTVHPDNWQSFFDMVEESVQDSITTYEVNDALAAPLIPTRWNLKAIIASFADEELVIDKTELSVHDIQSTTKYAITEDPANGQGPLLKTTQQKKINFSIDVRTKPETMKSTDVNALLSIYWHRKDDKAFTINCTALAVPPVTLSNSEPRILASKTQQDEDGAFVLEYMFENPSMHLLSLSISMEPSGEYAFSGAKQTALQILPISRHKLRYILQPLVHGVFIQPQLKVIDTYFKQVLQPISTGDLKSDANGVLIWVAPIT